MTIAPYLYGKDLVLHNRFFFSLAYRLGCFALLMMLVGPIISGAQGVVAGQAAGHTAHTQHSHDAHADQQDEHSHALHHALMGHIPNPYVPQWVNDLMMCGYCELMTLSPALLLALMFALAVLASRPASIFWAVAEVFSSCLQLHAAPRAPPLVA